MGRLASEVLKKKVGDTVQIETTEFPIVGIFDSNAVVESGAILLSLKQMQAATGNPGKANFVNIRLAPGTNEKEVQTLCDEIKRVYPAGRATRASEVVGHQPGVQAGAGDELGHVRCWR